ncbi:hypothetical protein FQA39_LY19217 [Lamprigera yunnana]|nr:hypothetical protein FQA39_LY19217 [Lamprigera yunnana]
MSLDEVAASSSSITKSLTAFMAGGSKLTLALKTLEDGTDHVNSIAYDGQGSKGIFGFINEIEWNYTLAPNPNPNAAQHATAQCTASQPRHLRAARSCLSGYTQAHHRPSPQALYLLENRSRNPRWQRDHVAPRTPLIVLKTEYARGGRGAATVRMKLKSLIGNFGTENVFKADDKIDNVILDKKDCTYSYFADPMYVWMDAEFNQYEVEAENMGDTINFLEDGMQAEVVFYDGKAISCELPTTIVREITWTEPAVKGDTSGKVMKPAKIATGFEVAVPLFVAQEDKIEIDTRTGEYRKRV